MRLFPLTAALLGCLAFTARAKPPVQPLPTVEVTTSRRPVPVDQVPAGISVIPARELQLRGATGMAGALALVSGVQAPAGGDAGPSSAVPAFWGLHEFDAFLLVVDGVPWGGAFNPSIATLDLNDVQRVEVLKGPAPVMYGATSFVGVVQALHYPAGQASNTLSLGYGSRGSLRASAALVLPRVGRYRQSLAVDGTRRGFADPRESVADSRMLYRGALDTAQGTFTVDASLASVRDVPPSPVLRTGSGLTTRTPVDANFNPANARIDHHQAHLALGYRRATPWGEWSTRLSATRSGVTDIRAFLHPDLSGAADTQHQQRHIDDGYLDSHLIHALGPALHLTLGADALYGYGRQTTLNGNSAYTVPLDGSVLPPPTTSLPVNEIGTVRDTRLFLGQYAQLDWQPDPRWNVSAGLRLNETRESKFASDQALPGLPVAEHHRRDVVKPTVALGASHRFWQHGADRAVAYADLRSAYKPAAIDFGPDYQPAVLLPETTRSYAVGLRGALLGGALRWKAEGFDVRFHHLVVASSSGFLVNAGGEQLRGSEFEARYRMAPALTLVATLAFHRARFTRYLYTDPADGRVYNVAGRSLPLSPHVLATAGILYAPARGFYATLVARYAGRRYLDERNIAPVGGYTTLAATLGYRLRRYAVSLEARNLGNRRPPVTASEFGSQSFYLLNARTAWLRLTYFLAPPHDGG